MLAAIGVSTCGDLFKKRGLLLKLYSPISYNYFLRVSAGVGSTTVQR
jgi:DNA polymerase kappa